MLKFIHAADIHLDSPLLRLEKYEGAPLRRIRHATRRALENLVSLAVEQEAAFVLIAGDLYDGDWRDYNTGLFFIRQMTRLRDAGIEVFIIAGNHDSASTMTRSLRLPEGVHLFPVDTPDTILLERAGVAVHGQGFAARAVRKDLSRDYPSPIPGYFNIGMLHTCATGRGGHEPYAPCTVEGLISKGYDYWALGHVHQREILSQSPPIIFSGNIQGRNIRETGPKGCMIVTVDDTHTPTAEFYPVDVLRWEKITADIDHFQDGHDLYLLVDEIIRQMEQVLESAEGRPVVARVEVTGNGPMHATLAAEPGRWQNEIRTASLEFSGDIFVEKVKFQTRMPGKENPEGRGHDITGPGPAGETYSRIQEIRSDPEQLLSLGGVLEDLFRKLPRELKEGSEALAPDDPDWISSVLEDVGPMLARYLTEKRNRDTEP